MSIPKHDRESFEAFVQLVRGADCPGHPEDYKHAERCLGFIRDCLDSAEAEIRRDRRDRDVAFGRLEMARAIKAIFALDANYFAPWAKEGPRRERRGAGESPLPGPGRDG